MVSLLCFLCLYHSRHSQSRALPSRGGLKVDATIVLPATITLSPIATPFIALAVNALGIESGNTHSCVFQCLVFSLSFCLTMLFLAGLSWQLLWSCLHRQKSHASSLADTISMSPLQDYRNSSLGWQPFWSAWWRLNLFVAIVFMSLLLQWLQTSNPCLHSSWLFVIRTSIIWLHFVWRKWYIPPQEGDFKHQTLASMYNQPFGVCGATCWAFFCSYHG